MSRHETIAESSALAGYEPEEESRLRYHMTADQQIRAKALECACLVYDTKDVEPDDEVATDMFWANVREFERYIQGK